MVRFGTDVTPVIAAEIPPDVVPFDRVGLCAGADQYAGKRVRSDGVYSRVDRTADRIVVAQNDDATVEVEDRQAGDRAPVGTSAEGQAVERLAFAVDHHAGLGRAVDGHRDRDGGQLAAAGLITNGAVPVGMSKVTSGTIAAVSVTV